MQANSTKILANGGSLYDISSKRFFVKSATINLPVICNWLKTAGKSLDTPSERYSVKSAVKLRKVQFCIWKY